MPMSAAVWFFDEVKNVMSSTEPEKKIDPPAEHAGVIQSVRQQRQAVDTSKTHLLHAWYASAHKGSSL